jgi:hypothetical protein
VILLIRDWLVIILNVFFVIISILLLICFLSFIFKTALFVGFGYVIIFILFHRYIFYVVKVVANFLVNFEDFILYFYIILHNFIHKFYNRTLH